MRTVFYKFVLTSIILLATFNITSCQKKDSFVLDLSKIKNQEIIKTFEKAKESKKPVILIFDAVWCSVCKALDAETLKNKNVVKTLEKFERVNVDVDENEDDATALRGKLRSYGGDGIPATIIFSWDGKEIERVIGFAEAEEYNDILKQVLKKLK